MIDEDIIDPPHVEHGVHGIGGQEDCDLHKSAYRDCIPIEWLARTMTFIHMRSLGSFEWIA